MISSYVQTNTSISDLSIIIVSYNTKKLLKNCIESIYETAKNMNYEIIVVDNASVDGSPELIEEEFNSVALIKNKANLGFARANNQAIKLAKGRYLLLLNSDTILREGTIETMVHFIERTPRAAAVGPKVVGADGTLQNKGFFFPSIFFSVVILFGINRFFPEKIKRRLFPQFYWDENDVREVDYLEGSCLLLRKEAVDEVGLLPEEYFMYFEDAEWCFRAKERDYEIWYLPTAEIIHYGSSSQLGKKTEVFCRNRLLFYKRNVGVLKGVIVTMLMICASSVDFFRILMKPRNRKEYGRIKEQLNEQFGLLKGLIVPLGLKRDQNPFTHESDDK